MNWWMPNTVRLLPGLGTLEFEITGLRGGHRWLETHAVPLKDAVGKIISLLGVTRDITERKRTEKELLTSEERLRVGLKTANIAVFNQDKDLRYVWMYQPQLGYNSKEVVGHTDADLLPSKTSKQVTEIKKHVLESGLKEDAEVPISIGGKDFIYYLVVEPLRDENNSIIGITGASLDITERKKAELDIINNAEQLRQLTVHLQSIREEERKRIGREIHDDLGQQLTAIKMDVAWIDKKTPEETIAIKEKLKNIITLLDGSNQSVRRILNELRPGILDEYGLLDALKWQGRLFTEATAIPIEYNTLEEEFKLETEIANCIYRAFQEALTNIMRYADAKKVFVTLQVTGDIINLTIKDYGKGFDPNIIKTENKTFGLLGMKERVRSLNGKLKLISSPGKGTEINIQLPYRE